MKKVIFLTILLLCASMAYATDLSVDVSPREQRIFNGEEAEYTLTVRHDQPFPITLEMYSLDVVWRFFTEETLVIPPFVDFTTTLHLRSLRNLQPGFYGVPITFRNVAHNALERKTIVLGFKPENGVIREYAPSLRATASMPSTIDPRTTAPLVLTIENLNRRNISSLNVRLRSNTISEDHDISISPLGKQTITLDVNFDELTPPQEDELVLQIVTEFEGDVYRFDPSPIAFNIKEYGEIEVTGIIEKSFLQRKNVLEFKNTGNAKKSVTHTVPQGFLSSLFTSISTDTIRENGQFSIPIILEPQETVIVTIKTNYWSLLITIILAFIVIGSYYLFRSPLVIEKIVHHTRKGADSGVLKIQLHIKNRSARKIEHMHVTEKVPKLFELIKDFKVGTLKPTSISRLRSRKSNEVLGTRMKWDVDHLKGGEIIILSYSMKSKLTMLGTIVLEPASTHFTRDGKRVTINSTSASIKI